MTTPIIIIAVIFVIGYISIALEHNTKIDKAASALLTGVLCWTVYVLNMGTLLPESQVPVWFRAFEDNKTALKVEEFNEPDHVLNTHSEHDSMENGDVEHGDSEHDGKDQHDEADDHEHAETHSSESESGDHSEEEEHAEDAHAGGHKLNLSYLVEGQLNHHLAEIAGILFFLMGAMTIVEIVDAFEGFAVITNRIKSTNKVTLMWVVCVLTFFMSAVLDNLTSTIVMVSLLKKLVKDKETRLFYAGMIVISANSGGAWTVIGDVTTTMLWIKGKIDALTVMGTLIVPSIVCMVVPLVWVSRKMKGNVERPENLSNSDYKNIKPYQQWLLLTVGFLALLFVPIFKSYTHLPPFMGMMFSLGFVWLVAELVNHRLDNETRSTTNVLEILRKIDSGSILFFLGILLAISCLASTGTLNVLAGQLDRLIGNDSVIAVLIGLLSAVVDNVPLVAAGIEMYTSPVDYPVNSHFWLFLAYCAGTGGSCLIIGSAAGVAAMGLEKIDFMWYLRKIAPLALVGYLAGALVYLVQRMLIQFPA